MIFQIHRHIHLSAEDAPDTFSWTLDKKDGDPLVRSGRDDFTSIKEARSDIAAARKSLKGASFAKVRDPEDRTT